MVKPPWKKSVKEHREMLRGYKVHALRMSNEGNTRIWPMMSLKDVEMGRGVCRDGLEFVTIAINHRIYHEIQNKRIL